MTLAVDGEGTVAGQQWVCRESSRSSHSPGRGGRRPDRGKGGTWVEARNRYTRESAWEHAQKVWSGHCSSPWDGPEPDITQTPVHKWTGSTSGAAMTADRLGSDRRTHRPDAGTRTEATKGAAQTVLTMFQNGQHDMGGRLMVTPGGNDRERASRGPLGSRRHPAGGSGAGDMGVSRA